MFCTLGNNAVRRQKQFQNSQLLGQILFPLTSLVKLPLGLKGLGWGNWALVTKEKIVRS